MTPQITGDQLAIVPANQASWDDLQAIFGTRDYPSTCQCQRFKIRGKEWDSDSVPIRARANRLREQTRCGQPEADATSGLVAYLDGEPAGWCAVEPRAAYLRLGRVPWAGRAEDRTDAGVWAVTCFVTRKGFRRRGITYALARATTELPPPSRAMLLS